MSQHPYIRCIEDQHENNKGKTWCGKRADGWTFTSVDHAAMNGRNKAYLVACPECTKAIIEALKEGQS